LNTSTYVGKAFFFDADHDRALEYLEK